MSAPPPAKQESIWESTPDVAADEEAVPPPRQSVVLATSGEPAPVADMSHMMMRPRSPPARYDRPSMPERPADTYAERRGPPPARAPSPYDERGPLSVIRICITAHSIRRPQETAIPFTLWS